MSFSSTMVSNHPSRPVHLLLVEDNPADSRIFEESMRESRAIYSLALSQTGQDAINYLFKAGKYSQAQRPDLIVLDLNLPGLNGHDVLKRVKQDESLRFIPVLVLTSSKANDDIMKSYGFGANSYMQKPDSLDESYDLAKTIRDYWFNLALLPQHP